MRRRIHLPYVQLQVRSPDILSDSLDNARSKSIYQYPEFNDICNYV